MSFNSDMVPIATQNQHGMGKKTLRVYLFGFFACVLLTLLPFYAVMQATLAKSALVIVIIFSAIVQLIVQVVCFLRLNAKDSEAMTNLLSFLMVVIVLFILVGGSMWIMYNLNYNMLH